MNHIALLFGGPSAEHDVSLVSAKSIFEVIEGTQIKVSLVGVTRKGEWKLISSEELKSTSFQKNLDLEQCGFPVGLVNENEKVFLKSLGSEEKMGPIDLAFPIIHGPYGEDGKLQSELTDIGLPFVGTDFLGCEKAFDKHKTKDILKEQGISQVPYLVFEQDNPSYENVKKELGLPFFVKPANMGSSIGISKVSKKEDFLQALADARIHDKKIIIEKGIKGRELETALLETTEGLKATTIGEIVPKHDFYSYEAKYLDDKGAELIIPAKVSDTERSEIQEVAKQAFQALGCRDYARADFFLSESGDIYFNEINTHPGFTSISQFPLLWKEEGMEYRDLILHLLKRAFER